MRYLITALLYLIMGVSFGQGEDILGCTVPQACNYDPTATINDGSCEFVSCLALGCTDMNACNYDPDAIFEDDTCEYSTCLDWGCTDLNACNYDPEAMLEDGSCDVLDAIDICGGDCLEDIDSDGICDDVDDCVGAYDECGVCNGDGAVYECGCSDIPEGDCDCNGDQLDALGVCGGYCAADVDVDGICDDVDDCVGALDECGVCNGPGLVYECGCSDIPEGDCDCDGNLLDALGVCGGFCAADVDVDGICDDVDDCVGALDECGMCNGEGIIEGYCDCDENILDALGVCGGNCEFDVDMDGLCDSEEIGCIHEIACNYDPIASIDDGTCIFNCPGCTDMLACNYDSYFLQEDGSCVYPGCTDMTSCNYDDSAGCDDNSCQYIDECGECGGTGTLGCAEPNACNYDSNADCNDMSCVFPGCTDDEACNFDQDAGCDDSSCDYATCVGCMYEFACNYNPLFTIADNNACEFGSCSGCTDIAACNYNPTVFDDDGSCEYCSCNDCLFGCINSEACNYNPNSISDDGTCLFFDECGECGGEGIPEDECDCYGNVLDSIGICGGDCISDINENQVCDIDEVFGCTYNLATNFNSEATADDGSCVYEECDLEIAYDIGYTDGVDSVVGNETYSCPSDLDGDGAVTTNDLLILLSSFGEYCEIVIEGCTSPTASNYDSDATDDDGSCIYPMECEGLIEHEGYEYSIVQIGDQCWFAENCRYLPEVSFSFSGDFTEPYYYVYDYQGTNVEAEETPRVDC